MSLSEMISRLISEGGFSEATLAKQAGTSQPTVNRARNGRGIGYQAGKNIEAIYYSTFNERGMNTKTAHTA